MNLSPPTACKMPAASGLVFFLQTVAAVVHLLGLRMRMQQNHLVSGHAMVLSVTFWELLRTAIIELINIRHLLSAS